MSLSGTSWFMAESLTGQNLGEDITTGAGGQSLREAWITTTGNYDNLVTAEINETSTQFQYAHNIFMLRGNEGGQGTRKTGFIDFNAYGQYPYSRDNLFETVTGSFNILTDAASAIILGQAGKGTVYIQGNDLNSFHTSQSQQTLNINRVGYDAGTAQFRDTGIGDGKGNPVLAISGSTQNVVIGGPVDISAAPHTKLHVSGNVNAAGGLTSNTNTLVVDDVLSQVGIGKITPGYPLDVVGVIKSSTNLLASNSVGIGTMSPSVVGHFYGDGAGAAGAAQIRIETGADGSDSTVEFAQAAVKGHVGYDDSSDRIFLTHSTTLAEASKGLFIDSTGRVGVGKITTAADSTSKMVVDGTLSATSLSTGRLFVSETVGFAGNNTFGDTEGDVQTMWGEVYFAGNSVTNPITVSAQTGSNTSKLYVDSSDAIGGSLVIKDNTAIQGGVAIGTDSNTFAKATLDTYDLWIKGQGISVFEKTNYDLKHLGDGTFSVVQYDGSSTYGLTIDGNSISVQGSANAEVKMGIGCEGSEQGLRIQGAAAAPTLVTIATDGDNGTSWLEHYEDQYANSVIRKPAGQHASDIDICNQVGGDVWLHAQGDNGNVTFYNPDHGHGGSLEFQQPTASNWYIRNRDADGKIYFKIGSTNVGYFDKAGLTMISGGINASGPTNVVGWAFTEEANAYGVGVVSLGADQKWTFTATTGTYRLIAMIRMRGKNTKHTQWARLNFYARKAGASAWTYIGDWHCMDRYKNNGRMHDFDAFQGMFRVTSAGTWEIRIQGTGSNMDYLELENMNIEWIGSETDLQHGLTGPLAL